MTECSRGELWWVNWNPARGSEQAGRRPALILQTDAGNHNERYPNTIVLAVTTKGRDNIPLHIRVEPDEGNGLSEASYVNCQQILTADKGRLQSRMGVLSGEDMARVEEAVRSVLGLSGF